MNDIKIPFAFLEEHSIVLSAKEIDFAISRKLIDLEDLEKIVDASLTKYPNDKNLLEIALHILLDGSYSNSHLQYLEIDYSGENRADGTITSDDNFINIRWRYIILLWLFSNRNNDSIDYDRINTVYASFGYPSNMEKFVSYMPTSQENNKNSYQNILHNWKEYLDANSYLLNP
ncbi:DUF2247 family protein [Psychrobacter sp. DAB_AL62B]|uniref:DUF2247 family protein n=1 Tax=Psychrobacter sp. DAB_AL62B TaxID=1028420 RepID=UPI0023819265|nr:DUF2247 family protein [Psychrobacter sp. DAB_AL62B]MDE4454434.1 DUF2247 family protein [Psychrobacter sp. DAB_AL62B]